MDALPEAVPAIRFNRLPYHYALVAQLKERPATNREVGSLNLSGGTNMHVWSSGRRHQTANLRLYTAGSNPATCSKIKIIDMESGAKR